MSFVNFIKSSNKIAQISKVSLISIFFLIIYFSLFSSDLIKYLSLGSSSYFGDYQLFKNALNCYYKDISPYTGPSELNCKGFNYGHGVLFFAPFKNFLITTNLVTVPIILIIIFTIINVKILNPKNYFEFIICTLALMNPSTLLLIERMNFDILLYIIIVILACNNFFFFNWLLVIYSFLFKFHPFIYGLIIFVEKEKRKIKNLILIFLFILISSISFIYIFRDEYRLMFESSGAWKMGLHYLFSIKAIPKVLKEAFSMHYGLVLLVIYTIFIIQIIKKSSNYNFTNNKYTFEKKLFFISTNSLLFCFVTFSNAFYREVFLILAIPYLLANINIFRNILLLLCIKYFFNFIYTIDLNFETFYHIDNIRIYKTHFLTTVFIKGLIDYVLMMFLGSIVLKMNLELLNVYKKPKIEIK